MKRVLLIATALLSVYGCSDTSEPPPVVAACDPAKTIGDTCAGVPSEPLCAEGACTTGSCSEVFTVTSQDELGQALSSATDGSCIALSAGTYGAITLPSGVSLFGRYAGDTRVGAITVTGGDDVRVRGVTVESGTITIEAGSTTIDSVRVSGSPSDGVVVEQGASVDVIRSEVVDSARYGIAALEGDSEVRASGTIIADNQGPGLWVMCAEGCACEAPATADISDTIISNNKTVGVSLWGAVATLTNVDVRDSAPGSNFAHGMGVAASHCSQLNANTLNVDNSADVGILIDDSGAEIEGASVTRNLRGMWIQSVGASRADTVTMRGATVDDNEAVAVGVANSSQPVSVINSVLSGTKLVDVPVLVNGVSAGAEEVGDGIAWKSESYVILDSVTVSDSARVAVLIDGPVWSQSAIINLTLSGTAEVQQILQQAVQAGDVSPSTSGTSPAVQTEEGEAYPVPQDIAIPPGV